MNLRHAAALALVGWYMCLPPDLRFPARHEWSCDEEVFKSANECEQHVTSLQKYFDQKLKGEKLLQSWHSFVGPIRCVPSDDPRLKKK